MYIDNWVHLSQVFFIFLVLWYKYLEVVVNCLKLFLNNLIKEDGLVDKKVIKFNLWAVLAKNWKQNSRNWC